MHFSLLQYLPITDISRFLLRLLELAILRKKRKSQRGGCFLASAKNNTDMSHRERDTETSLPKELLHFCQKWARLNYSHNTEGWSRIHHLFTKYVNQGPPPPSGKLPMIIGFFSLPLHPLHLFIHSFVIQQAFIHPSNLRQILVEPLLVCYTMEYLKKQKLCH